MCLHKYEWYVIMRRQARDRYTSDENAVRARYQLSHDLTVTMKLTGETVVTNPDGFGIKGSGRVIARLHETSYGFSWTWSWATTEPAPCISLDRVKVCATQHYPEMSRYVDMKTLAVKYVEQEIALRALVKQAYGFEMITEITGYKTLLIIGLNDLMPHRLTGQQTEAAQKIIDAIDRDIESRKEGDPVPDVILTEAGLLLPIG